MSTPLKETFPAFGAVSPARQLKKVDLPAPFGPISPMISPVSIDRSASETARKLPNAFDTPSASSSMARPQKARREPVPDLVQPARLESGKKANDPAIEDVGESGPAAAEPVVR